MNSKTFKDSESYRFNNYSPSAEDAYLNNSRKLNLLEGTMEQTKNRLKVRDLRDLGYCSYTEQQITKDCVQANVENRFHSLDDEHYILKLYTKENSNSKGKPYTWWKRRSIIAISPYTLRCLLEINYLYKQFVNVKKSNRFIKFYCYSDMIVAALATILERQIPDLNLYKGVFEYLTETKLPAYYYNYYYFYELLPGNEKSIIDMINLAYERDKVEGVNQ